MINRTNPVWAAAYGAFCATRAATRAQMLIDPPDASWWEKVTADAKLFADSAVDGLVSATKPEPKRAEQGNETLELHSGSRWEGTDVVDTDGFGICREETDTGEYVAIEDHRSKAAGLYPQDLAAFMRRNYPLLVGPPEHLQVDDREVIDDKTLEEARAGLLASGFNVDGFRARLQARLSLEIEHRVMKEQLAEVRSLLSALSSKLGAGLGDESRSLAEYVHGIEAEIGHHLSAANKRIDANAQDAVLLDAIVEAYENNGQAELYDAVRNAFADRMKL